MEVWKVQYRLCNHSQLTTLARNSRRSAKLLKVQIQTRQATKAMVAEIRKEISQVSSDINEATLVQKEKVLYAPKPRMYACL